MAEKSVPVSMGSPKFESRDLGALKVTHAWFPPGAFLSPHVHERATFAVMLEGGFDLGFDSPAIRRRKLSCPPGTILTEPAGEKHANLIAEEGARVLVLQPDIEDELFRPVHEVLDGIHHFRHGGISVKAREVVRELTCPDALSLLSIESSALDMLVAAARLAPEERWVGEVPAWLTRAEEFVHENFRRPLRIADVAEVAGVHPAHLSDVFRRRYGLPLGTYMRRLRVQWAADRLAGSDLSISTIAFRAGFADQAHLTRTFKRETGWTPARYRKAHVGQ